MLNRPHTPNPYRLSSPLMATHALPTRSHTRQHPRRTHNGLRSHWCSILQQQQQQQQQASAEQGRAARGQGRRTLSSMRCHLRQREAWRFRTNLVSCSKGCWGVFLPLNREEPVG